MAVQELLPRLSEAIKTAEAANVLSSEEWETLDMQLRTVVIAAIANRSPQPENET